MRALLLEDAGRLSLREIESPIATAHETVVDIEITGIGGSEYLGYRNPGIRSLPSIMGHGFAGITQEGRRVAVNPLRSCGECEYCAEGHRQLCESWNLIGVHSNGGFAEQTVVPKDALVDLPDTLTWEQSAFIEPFANSINAWELSEAQVDDRIAVIGAGGLGLGVIARANVAGCTVVEVSDPSHHRVTVAAQWGATVGKSSVSASYDVVFETVGTAESRHRALSIVRKGGRCVFLGFAEATMELNVAELIRHQKQILGSFVYSGRQFSEAVELAGRTDSSWIDNLSFKEVEPMLQRYLDGEFAVIKSALRPKR